MKFRLAAVTLALVLLGAVAPPLRAATGKTKAAPIEHVFVINLENKGYDETFGPDSPAPYLSKDLPTKGALLTQYYGTSHVSLGNYISQVSGQAPNVETQSDCQMFTEFVPGVIGPDGQAIGQGCVYPATVKTIADQLTAAGLTWRGYMGDMGNDPSREPATCAHPDLNGHDETQVATAEDSYATRHNPFMYFHSIIDSPSCDQNVVALTALAGDLRKEESTPNLVYITPSLCDDAHDAPCADGRPGGLVSADAFLRAYVPELMKSEAYKHGGLIVITFDESDGPQADASACCNEPTGFNTPMPGITGPGGGRVGAVLLSPCITPGTVSDTPYNHYSLLRSMEDVFGLDHLGYAAADGLVAFGDHDDVYTHCTGKGR